MDKVLSRVTLLVVVFVVSFAFQPFAQADKGNAACPGEDVFYNPDNGQDIIVPEGYKVEVFAKDLNFPTDIAFVGSANNFKAYVLESGTGLPGRCNNRQPAPPLNANAFGGAFSTTNPFTPDIVVFDQNGNRQSGTIGKPTSTTSGFQADGPAIGLGFARGFNGGTLFATDSNQGVRGAQGGGNPNNSSRIVTVDTQRNTVTPFIVGLPTGDHPSEQIAVKDNWIYWSQGSTTNAGVTGLDNGNGGNQHEIPCQRITLSNEFWESPDNSKPSGTPLIKTSGYSNFGVYRPGAVVPAFEGASSTAPTACTGAILRARIDTSHPASTIQAVAWGFRNPFGIRFPPKDHPLGDCLFVTENGEDERGARPTNNSPDRLQCARQNDDGTPSWHGWPDRFGFLDSTQAVFNPIGGGGDDLCNGPLGTNFRFPACKPTVVAKDAPVRHVLAFPPQQPVAPLALEPSDVAAVGTDFVPDSFAHGVVKRGAALVSREGDFGFSPSNGNPEAGHDVELVNFQDNPLVLKLTRFAFNCPASKQHFNPDGSPVCLNADGSQAETEQAFVARLRGINRPVTVAFGPDGAAYLVDYGAVRDPGGSDPGSAFKVGADAPLVQIPGTGVIWKISRIGQRGRDDDRGRDRGGDRD